MRSQEDFYMNGRFSIEQLLENKEKLIRTVIIIMIAIAAVFVFFVQPKHSDDGIAIEESSAYDSSSSYDASEDPQVVICDVSGAVNAPQVVELQEGSRIEDAIQAAGGLTKEADITNINRAAVVNDGDKIIIPEKGQVQNGSPAPSSDASTANGQAQSPAASAQQPVQSSAGAGASTGKININSADATQLQTITGVGPVTAQKIIDYRTQNGGFKKIEDLTSVSGIGEKTFEKMKDQVCV